VTGGVGAGAGTCFGRALPAAGFAGTTFGTTGTSETTLPAVNGEVVSAKVVWRGAVWIGVWIVGAWTMPGAGFSPSAMPSAVAGDASSRGNNAPPTTATTSNSPAITRSVRLMFPPSPADNFPEATIGRRDGSLEIEGV
jgi:hypothetical protein